MTVLETEVEWADLVNDQDEIVLKLPREKILKENLLHRSVGILVYNLEGDLLIHQRSADKKISPNKWDCFVAGGVRTGETYEQAAQRELKEEIGIQGTELLFLFKQRMDYDIHFFLSVYETHTSQNVAVNSVEIQNFEFIKLENLEKLLKERKFTRKSYILMPGYLNDRK